MRIRTTILFVAVTFFGGQSFAQLNTFKLSDYKLPYLKRRALDINFNMEGTNNFTKFTLDSENNSDKNQESSYTNNIRLNYNSYLNSIKKQQQTVANLYLSSSFSGSKQNDMFKRKSYGISPLFEFRSYNRYYYKTNNFFEINYTLNYRYEKTGNKSWEEDILNDKRNRTSNNFNVSLPIKIGSGRIEPIQDARHAIYIIDELKKEDKISKELSHEDIIKFAVFVSELKNKRFFDSRLRRIAELEALDSFLKTNDYISQTDSRYFTTLLDFWEYGNTTIRNSGQRISLMLVPRYGITSSSIKLIDSNTKEKRNYLSFIGGVEYAREKPINLYWQNNIWAYANAQISNSKNEENTQINKDRGHSIQIGFTQSFVYYPNTRTNAWFSYTANYSKNITKEETDNSKQDFDELSARTALEIDYYISPKFRFNFYASIFFNWDEHTFKHDYIDQLAQNNYESSSFIKSSRIQSNFTLGFFYSIF